MSLGRKIEVDAEAPFALVVDVDGTLIRSDLLVESAFAFIGAHPARAFVPIAALWRGKAALKAALAAQTPLDVAHLPYDERVLAIIEAARQKGRKIYVASASNARYVAAVADHIGADGWFASDENENLAADAKARRLVAAFGERRFDYIGNDRADLPIWAACRGGWAVAPSAAVRRALPATNAAIETIAPRSGGAKEWIRLLRVHQWVKNALVFVPMLTAHRLDGAAVADSLAAFFAFCCAASSVYIVNDLVDLDADRKHPTKKRRPLAAGTVSILVSIPVALALAAAALGLALATSGMLAAALLAYMALTTVYTFWLKRKMIVDVITLALLFTLRVIGGAAAISAPLTEWLLAFSMFIFTSLALIKRYVELAARIDADLPDPTNRNYRKSDLGVIAALAAASGYNAVTVFALYVSSENVRLLYRTPWLLWLVCPILMYWLGRALMMAQRRTLNDDPIVFALHDANSLFALGLIGVILFAATRAF